ncbi:hypothetical protein [Motilimonas sp. KMU-193]
MSYHDKTLIAVELTDPARTRLLEKYIRQQKPLRRVPWTIGKAI